MNRRIGIGGWPRAKGAVMLVAAMSFSGSLLLAPAQARANGKDVRVKVVHAFDGVKWPRGLTRAADGQMYGVFATGSCGVIYRLAPKGEMVVVHDFGDGVDGCGPSGELLAASDGHLYGVTGSGGTSQRGVVYRFDTNGGYTVIANFEGPDSYWHSGALLEGRDGLFYGTTAHGGQYNHGTIFSASREGEIRFLHSFKGTDGDQPHGELLQLDDDSLIGVTEVGGPHGYGVIYKNDRHGNHAVIQGFKSNSTDGKNPAAGLTFGADGKLYGTAGGSGRYDAGTLFRLDRDGTHFKVVHRFGPNGSTPLARLVLADDGKLLGTTAGGGDGLGGVIFSLDTAGKYHVLGSFGLDVEGAWSRAPLSGDGKGHFYGSTTIEGPYGYGTLFRFNYP